MRTIIAAIGCLIGLVAGGWLGRDSGSAWLVLTTVSLASAVTVLAWLRVVHRDSRVAATCLAFGLLFAAGLIRGASVGAVERERSAIRSERSLALAGPSSLREFEVVGASQPGPSCTVVVRQPERSSAAEIEIEFAESACPLAHGERLAVVARELEAPGDRLPTPSETWSTGERSPWPRPTPELGSWTRARSAYWREVAEARQVAWEVSRGDRAASLSAAIGLGLRSTLDPDDADALRGSGLGHLIAVSGLQIALAGLWLQALARRIAVLSGWSARTTCFIAWLPLLAYVGLTGAAAPAVRAALMLVALDLGTLTGRPAHGPTLLALVAAGMALVEPAWVFDPGFQLSVAAMAAIVTAPTEQGVLASSWRITWATAPLTLIHFDVAPLHALIGNAIALPLFSLLMPASVFGWVLYDTFGDSALVPARVFAEPILDVAHMLARLPSAHAGTLALVGLGLLIVDGLCRARGRTPSGWLPPRFACAWLVLIAIPLALGWPRPSLAEQLARERFDWVAVGTPLSRSLLVRESGPVLTPRACLIRPVLGARDTTTLLAELGVGELVAIVESAEQPSDDARTEALREQLRRAGFVARRESLERCVVPDPPVVRVALRACQARHGGRGRIAVLAFAGRTRCWTSGRWTELIP